MEIQYEVYDEVGGYFLFDGFVTVPDDIVAKGDKEIWNYFWEKVDHIDGYIEAM